MMPLPGALGGKELVAWRLDQNIHRGSWDSGEGAYRVGGRWNSRGVRAVYCSLDPATAILEVAVHKGFRALDIIPHVMTSVDIEPSDVHIVDLSSLPNPNWITPGTPSRGQQQFGDDLLAKYRFVLLPSAVSKESWNLIFSSANAKGAYKLRSQELFALDTRLHPPAV